MIDLVQMLVQMMTVLFVKPRSACGALATTAFLKYLQRAEKCEEMMSLLK